MKKELRNPAKSLYMEMNDDGSRKYTLHDIAAELQKTYDSKVNVSTISRWAAKEGWEAEMNAERMKRLKELEKSLTFDNEKIQGELYEIYRLSRLMIMQTANIIVERLNDPEKKAHVTTRELIAANKAFTDSLGKSIEYSLGKNINLKAEGEFKVSPDTVNDIKDLMKEFIEVSKK